MICCFSWGFFLLILPLGHAHIHESEREREREREREMKSKMWDGKMQISNAETWTKRVAVVVLGYYCVECVEGKKNIKWTIILPPISALTFYYGGTCGQRHFL